MQIKRMQQLEEEGAMLKRGLEMVDMARDWYLRQLSALQDKQRMLGKVSFNVSAVRDCYLCVRVTNNVLSALSLSLSVSLSAFLLLILLLCSAAIPLGFTILGEIFAYVTVSYPTIEVVTFCLCGWCMQGVF